MACDNCFQDCDPKISDQCVKYTGPDIPLLDICNGDQLSAVEAAIIAKLLKAIDGTEIVLSDITPGCSFMTTLLGFQDKTLANLIQVLFNAGCSLKTLIDELNVKVGEEYEFNLEELPGVDEDSTPDEIIQALITELTSNDDRITAIEEDYVKASDLDDLIAQYNTTSGTTVVSQWNLRMVPYIAYPYFGALTNFDSAGVGLSSKGFEKVYICSGNNGTIDSRGRTLVGAIANVPGPTLDSIVDPTLPANVGRNYALKEKFGKATESLDSTHIAAHSHVVTDDGHTHTEKVKTLGTEGGNRFGYVPNNNGDGEHAWNAVTSKEKTGITIGSTGGSQAHNNVQPSIGVYFIAYIP